MNTTFSRLILFMCLPLLHTVRAEALTFRDFAERDTRPIESRVIKTVDGQELVLLICRPDGWAEGQQRPGLIWVHGGGWTGGHPDMFTAHMRYSASRGAVAFGVQYRLLKPGGYKDNKKLTPEENEAKRAEKHQAFVEGPSLADCIGDCADAVRYIREHAETLGVDPQKLASIGDSSGAHLAASLGTVVPADARVNAVVACSSISDLTYKFGRTYLKPSPGFEGKELEEDPDRLARAQAASPLHNITADTPPVLILAGGNDWLGDEPERFHAALREKGIDSTYKLYPQAKHAFLVYGYSATIEEITQTLFDLDAFLVQHGILEGAPTLAMPVDAKIRMNPIVLEGPFPDKQVLTAEEGDFPPFLNIAFQVKPEETFDGILVSMTGKWGFRYNVNNRSHDFSGLRFRLREKQQLFTPGVWQEVRIELGPETIHIRVGDQSVEVANTTGQSFLSNEMVFGEDFEGEIRDIRISTTDQD